jgi:hypothetical protein
MIGLILAVGALGAGFVFTRDFVKRRLRYVDAIRRPGAPVVAGVVATAVILPVAALPLITMGTALAFGVGVAGGVASGRRDESTAP